MHEFLIKSENVSKNGQKLRIFVTFMTTYQNRPIIS